MKLKSLLFGSAAALMAVTGAQAAEPLLPIAEPVDYVRICDVFGTGFFYIPGTDTCLRIGGYVRAEYVYDHDWDEAVVLAFPHPDIINGREFWRVRPREDRNYHEFGTRARARLTFDTRTQSRIGMVRTFTDLWYTSGPVSGRGNVVSGDSLLAPGNNIFLRTAFIQIANDWGTLTFGRADSFFEFWESDAWATRFGDDAPLSPVNLAAATFNLGGGVSATVALEDSITDGDRRRFGQGGAFHPVDLTQTGIADAVAVCAGDGFPNSGFPNQAFAFGEEVRAGFCPVGATGIYGGNRVPDVVANIRVDQAWGSAQVMAALHQIRARAFTGPDLVPDAEPSNEWGWAVGAGAGIDIPGTGITFNIQGVYADGAIGFATSGGPGFLTDGVVVGVFNPLTHPTAPGDLVSTSIDTTEAWSIKAGINGNLAPDWIFNLQGSFARVDLPDVLGAPVVVADAAPNAGPFFSPGVTAVQTRVHTDAGLIPGPVITSDYDFWTVSGYVAWAPIRGFVTGLELNYEKIDFDNGGDLDRWGGVFRVQRTF
jgi:hypothetical protein